MRKWEERCRRSEIRSQESGIRNQKRERRAKPQAKGKAGGEVVEILSQVMPIQLVDLGPTRGFAQFVSGDVEQSISFANLVRAATGGQVLRAGVSHDPFAPRGTLMTRAGTEIGIGLSQG